MSQQRFSLRLRFAAALPLLLAGCVSADPQLGLNVQTNALAQIIELDPVYAGVPIEGGSGERNVEAVRRYHKGKVTALDANAASKK
jgi:hypothetical protein